MQYYDRYWTTATSEELRDFALKWPIIRKHIPLNTSYKILDYGCGEGRVLKEVKSMNPNATLYGVDVSLVALNIARKSFKNLLFYKVQEGGTIPLKDRTVDCILAIDVIEHVYDTEYMFNEFARILKPGGKILISTPYCGIIKNLIIALVGFEKVYDPTGPHIRYFTKNSLTKCLNDIGCKSLQWEYFGRVYPIYKGMFVIAEKISEKRMHISNFVPFAKHES